MSLYNVEGVRVKRDEGGSSGNAFTNAMSGLAHGVSSVGQGLVCGTGRKSGSTSILMPLPDDPDQNHG